MRIKVTKQELLDLLTKAIGSKITEVVISKSDVESSILYEKIERAMMNEFNIILRENLVEIFTSENKIPAIKVLRKYLFNNGLDPQHKYGLAWSKWVVENWNTWINFVKTHNRVPDIIGDLWSETGPYLC